MVGVQQVLAQVVRHAMRKSDAEGVFATIEQKNGRGVVTYDTVQLDGKYVNQATVKVTVLEPDEGKRELTLTQTAPGRYSGDFPLDKPGAYQIQMVQTAKGMDMVRQSRALVVNYDDELRLRSTNEALLREIARVSGGAYNPTPEEVFAPDGRTASRPLPLWPYLLIAAMPLFVADVALRRIDFDLLLGRSKPPMKTVMQRR